MAEILLIEPDYQIRSTMQSILTSAGHECALSETVSEAQRLLLQHSVGMTVLNARLPWAESCTFLRMLEKKGLPVLFLTADEGNVAHLKAMYQSECDVLLRPFSAQALLDAVDRLLHSVNRLLTLGRLQMDLRTRRVTLDNVQLSLTSQEFELLRVLMQTPEIAVSREQLLRSAWGYQGIGVTRTVDVHVQRLRRKLGFDSIETVYKTGYRLRNA